MNANWVPFPECISAVLVLLAIALLASSPAWAAAEEEKPALVWRDIVELGIENQGWKDAATPFDRLPARAEGVVRDPVWRLSQDSAGLCVRFVTDAPAISARWTLRDGGIAMDHMPATGVSGLDLYVKDAGTWHWTGLGRPSAQTNEKQLAGGIPEGSHEFLLYLPLYNGVTSVELGVPEGHTVEPAPPYPPERARPIVIYGTSIVQGGCAARPGMAHTNILHRMLDRPVINLGFSGNGKMDPELGDLLAELDVAVYVIDCAPNLTPELIAERTEPLVETLRKARPDTPIVLVENIRYQAGAFLPAPRESYEKKNDALRAAYQRLIDKGVKGLTYVPCDDLLGDDCEATVDGTHPTDVGFLRMAITLDPFLRRVLEE